MLLEQPPLDTEIAWAAGFFDGEGSVFINNEGYLIVTILNTHLGSIELFRRIVGGGNINEREGSLTGYKKTYSLYYHGAAARLVLEMLLPYLVIKKEKAEGVMYHF